MAPGPGGRTAAASAPVARVVVDTPLPHLDRPFDYLVPATLDEQAVPGCRVRVRFAGKLVDGFLLERAESSEHRGRLAYLERVVSPEPVLTPEIARLARAVADRYAGTLSDVLRLAIPPRHARVEAEPADAASGRKAAPGPDGAVLERAAREWAAYPAGRFFLAALADGRAPRAVWNAIPGAGPDGPRWPRCVAAAVRVALAAGRGALVVVPDGKDVDLVHRALGDLPHVALTADLGPAERYRRWLRVRRGEVRAVVGTRAAMFAPVADLGLAVIWDDGDDLHAEPRAPYPHAREVLALRAHLTGAALLVGGYARTAEATRLVATGWARPLTPDRGAVRAAAPRVRPSGDDAELARDEAARAARLPSLAWRTLKRGLADGPVLVQVPRRGYLPALACRSCRAPARCGHSPAAAGAGGGGPSCGGPLALRSGHAMPYCRWCGRVAGAWRCPACGDTGVRAVVVGARRTAEELGRAFPAVPVRTSGRDGVLTAVGPEPALVVATPGAEPVAAGGYAAAVLLDGWALLGRPDLRAAEETLRRWMNAAALLRPRAELVVCAEAALAPTQALVRWDPVTFSERELAERAELGFPPAVRVATLTGVADAVRELAAALDPPPGAQILGPVPLDPPRPRPGEGAAAADDRPRERLMVRVPGARGAELARALKAASAARSARRAPDPVQVRIDPLELV
ncbi:MAG: primosomal protein N' [Actinomycetes bacterium]